MSLKVFHIIFILASISLAVFCAVWAFQTQAAPAFAYTSLAVALILAIYGVYFFRKAKNIIT